MKQVRWDSEEPPPVSVKALPVMPLSPDEEMAAGRRRVLRMAGIVVGAAAGLVAYTALMTFLALLAAGMKFL